MKPNTFSLVLFVLLTYFAPTFGVKAVVPPPDGGYPNFTTAEGTQALQSLTTGAGNTGVGWRALFADTTGSFNTGLGAGALVLNQADSNTAVGAVALLLNTTGFQNTAVGTAALLNNIASDNTAVGSRALSNNTAGGSNTAMGSFALFANTMGFSNTAIGVSALGNASGFDNTALGVGAGAALTTANNVICIGKNVFGANVDNSCFIGNIWNQPGGSQAVYVNADGKLGAQVSSRRFKDEIRPMEQASEVIYGLKPVSFRYKPEIEPTRPIGFGLIAEEVEKISPDLVTRNGDGQVISVRYEAINSMLLNEFLEEHRKNSEQQTTIAQLKSTVQKQEAANAQLQKRIEALTAGLQKVSTLLELNKSASQVVENNQ